MRAALIRINHQAIKKQQAKEAFGLYKKISKIEDTIECFDTIDQRLFKNWSQVLLQPLENKTEALSRDLDELNQKHDHITAIAELDAITYTAAYKMYQDEEQILLGKSKKKIAEALKHRQIRENYLKIKKQSVRLQSEFSAASEGPQSQMDESEDLCNQYLNNMAQTEKTFSARFSDVVHLKAEQIDWENHYQASRFMSVLIERARISGIENDWRNYFSAMALAPRSFHKVFKNYLLKHYKIESELDLLNMQERSYAYRKEVYASQLKQNLSPADNEAIKLIYRKLVRHLHPDSPKDNNINIDYESLWEQTQAAYQQKDKKQLENLEKYFCLLRGDLDHLNSNDFNTLSGFLQRQLFYRRLKNKELRKDLAWGFSKKKSLDSLEKKLKAPYLEEIKILEHEIQRLHRKFSLCETSSVQLEFQFSI